MLVGRRDPIADLVRIEGLHGAEVAGSLDDDDVPGIEQRAPDKIEALLRSVGNEDLVRGYRDAAAGHPAVSYTHLRAHETVLDLVCRLLLEKKKIPLLNSSSYQPTNTENRTCYTL